MTRLIYLILGIFFSSVAAASPQGNAQAIFENFLSDFTAGNSDAVAAHFTEDALFWGTAS